MFDYCIRVLSNKTSIHYVLSNSNA